MSLFCTSLWYYHFYNVRVCQWPQAVQPLTLWATDTLQFAYSGIFFEVYYSNTWSDVYHLACRSYSRLSIDHFPTRVSHSNGVTTGSSLVNKVEDTEDWKQKDGRHWSLWIEIQRDWLLSQRDIQSSRRLVKQLVTGWLINIPPFFSDFNAADDRNHALCCSQSSSHYSILLGCHCR